MERHVSGFLRSALAWLVLGSAFGGAMALHPAWIVYRPAHVHMLLLGFVTMMIAGVAYHVIPRFTMARLHSTPLARLHLVIANIGLVLMVTGFIWRVHGPATGGALLGVGGLASVAGTWAFAWNLWRTLDQAVPTPSRLPTARPLPTAPH